MDGSLAGLTSLLGAIRQTYPQARITSGYRGPDNPLTRKNPRSFHAHGSPDDPQAVDVAPIPGVSFNDYVSSIKRAGVPVAQAFDEASHPFPWTTGPNWHIAQGQAQQMVQQRKRPSLASLGQSAFPVAGGMDPLAPSPEPYYAPQPPQARTLADLGPSAFPVAANGADPLAPKKSKFTAGNIMGVLGDALMAYGGLQPQFGPGLARQHELDQQQGFDREKLSAMLDLKRQQALMPKPPTQTDRYVQEILDPNTAPARRALLRAILTRPNMVVSTGTDGSQYTQPVYPGDTSGDDGDWENI